MNARTMAKPIAYDITRLVTRVLNPTPNGIDRVDHAFATHFVDPAAADRFGLIATAVLHPRVFPADASRAAIDGIAAHWGEENDPARDPAYLKLAAHLSGTLPIAMPAAPATPRRGGSVPRVAQDRAGRIAGILRWCRHYGAPIGRSPQKALPRRARYINVSQFPLWIASYFAWLESRPDIKAVFFIHDLLPLELPEYFPTAEFERHRCRLVNLARFGAAAIVTTECVAESLSAHLAALGRRHMPILVAPVPVAPVFHAARNGDGAIDAPPYFVMCGTIEPRKNHLMILHAWRELVRRDGPLAPKLVLVGTRGWKFEPVVDLLERSTFLAQHVVEVSGLSTPAMKHLLDGARALLMPSFAEGYGLPVREALAAGIPVVASDIPAFRALAGERVTLLSPIDGEAWLGTVRALARAELLRKGRGGSGAAEADRAAYFETIDGFVSAL
jgi:glycosyltransferase involved in cell wall biosynthesis